MLKRMCKPTCDNPSCNCNAITYKLHWHAAIDRPWPRKLASCVSWISLLIPLALPSSYYTGLHVDVHPFSGSQIRSSVVQSRRSVVHDDGTFAGAHLSRALEVCTLTIVIC
jgi:hypothetical protein